LASTGHVHQIVHQLDQVADLTPDHLARLPGAALVAAVIEDARARS
jgi:hypothetical protein